jgi:hypothetical protein
METTTTWECTNPNCETRKEGLFIISSQPSYARVRCKECGAPMQIASSGPHAEVLFVGQMPDTVLSAGALPMRRTQQGFWGCLFGARTQVSVDDPDISSYPKSMRHVEIRSRFSRTFTAGCRVHTCFWCGAAAGQRRLLLFAAPVIMSQQTLSLLLRSACIWKHIPSEAMRSSAFIR